MIYNYIFALIFRASLLCQTTQNAQADGERALARGQSGIWIALSDDMVFGKMLTKYINKMANIKNTAENWLPMESSFLWKNAFLVLFFFFFMRFWQGWLYRYNPLERNNKTTDNTSINLGDDDED